MIVNHSASEKLALETVAAIERFDRLDIVVAHARVEVVDQKVVDFTEADYERVFGINTKGAFFTLQRAAKSVTDGGRYLSRLSLKRRRLRVVRAAGQLKRIVDGKERLLGCRTRKSAYWEAAWTR